MIGYVTNVFSVCNIVFDIVDFLLYKMALDFINKFFKWGYGPNNGPNSWGKFFPIGDIYIIASNSSEA